MSPSVSHDNAQWVQLDPVLGLGVPSIRWVPLLAYHLPGA